MNDFSNKNGFVSLIKPKGWTSNQLLSKLKWLFQIKKAGHGGTLDPFATGVIPIFFGEATKFSNKFLNDDKEYIANLELGFHSSTGDTEGNIEKDLDFDFNDLPSKNLNKILKTFEGEQLQKPPIYSAIKFKGKPMYEYARKGEAVIPKTRKIMINKIEYISLNKNQLIFKVACSKGTYIRTLGEDIAKKIGTKGYLSDLVRTKVGHISEKESVNLEKIEASNEKERYKFLTPIENTINLPKLILDKLQSRLIIQGQPLDLIGDKGEYLLFDSKKFIGLGVSDGKELKPIRMIKNEIN
jgi:tRNA pseudouridine55 synthase